MEKEYTKTDPGNTEKRVTFLSNQSADSTPFFDKGREFQVQRAVGYIKGERDVHLLREQRGGVKHETKSLGYDFNSRYSMGIGGSSGWPR